MLVLSEIQQIQFELTTRCNARCPMCIRNYRGMDYNAGYPETELSLQDIKKILDPTLLKQLKLISFNGNLGDFALAKDAAAIVEYLVENQVPSIRINTNGSVRTPEWWAKLALPGVTVGFALDGSDSYTHSLYRQDTDFDRVIENATAFIRAGGTANWRFIPFDHNRHQESTCRQMSKDLGFFSFENIGHGRDRGPVFHRDGKFRHWIGKPYHNEIPDIRPMLEDHVTWYNKDTVNSIRDVTPLNIGCRSQLKKELYVSANGDVYPCCFLGYYPRTMNHPGNEQLKNMVKNNNALDHSLAECIEWFNLVEESWSKSSIREGRLFTCVETCGGRKDLHQELSNNNNT